MLPGDARVISVDDHIIEHPTVWWDRLPRSMRDAGPRVVEAAEVRHKLAPDVPSNAQVWVFEEKVLADVAPAAVIGRPREEQNITPARYSDVRPGCYDPKARLVDMDTEGVDAQVCFPSFPGFAGTRFLRFRDKELALACVRAYNDFVMEEWAGLAPDRFVPNVIVPLWDVEAATEEFRRTVALGARTLAFPENPSPLRLPSFHTDHWDPLFAEVEDAGIPLSMHFGTSGVIPKPSEESPEVTTLTLFVCNAISSVVEMLFSKMFLKFPQLKVSMAEAGSNWVPAALERANWMWEEFGRPFDVNPDDPPGELYRDRIYTCFTVDEKLAIEDRHRIGVNQMMVESDYPHAASSWPNTRTRLEELLADVPDDEAIAIAGGNAARLFGL